MIRRSRLLVLLLCLCGLLVASEARADSKAEARRYFQRGMALLEDGQYREGIRALEKAYEIRPHRNVLFNIGRAYASLGKLATAIEYFERYLSTNPPDSERVRSTLAELQERQGLRQLVNRGMRAIKRKRYRDGISDLNRAYERRPHPNILFNIGRAYEDSGDSTRAIATYRRYLKSSPKDARRVRGRIARLEKKQAAATVARVDRRRKTTRRRKDPPPPPPPPPPSRGKRDREGLSAAQLDQLAAVIIQKMKDEGAFEKPEVVVAPPPPEEVETDPPVGEVSGTETATAIGLGDDAVPLEAKDGEVYETRVVTASRRAQSPLDAPNAVTIITDEDIRLSGARTIPDLLRRVPGMDVMAMSYSDYNVAVRGFNRRVANKVLVLIDGRTAYQDFLGGTLWRGFMIGLQDIERIEVVRGPGSAIYGAYAYTGMINIITKRPDQLRGSVAQLSAGNGSRFEGAYQYGERRGPIGVRLSIGYERGDKYELEFDPERVDYITNEDDVMKSLDMARADLVAEYNLPGETGRFYAGGSVRSGFNELYGVAALRNQAINGQEYNLRGGFQSDLFSFRAFWNRLDTKSSPQFFQRGVPDLGSTVNSDLISLEPVFRPEFELLGEHHLVIGGEYRHKFISWDYINADQKEDHFAAFFQDSWKFSDTFSMIISGRLDLHPLIGPLGSPRVALIYKPAPNQALRLSVGTAFRQPTMAETYLDLSASSPVAGVGVTLIGDRDLDPEAIQTVDIGYRIQPDFGDFELVGYFNRVTNLIVRSPLQPSGPGEQYDPALNGFVAARSFYLNNPDTFYAIGTELSATIYPVDGVDVGANYALQYIFDSDTGDRFTDSPMHKFSVWAQLRTRFGLNGGLSLHFTSNQEWVEPEFDASDPSGFNTEPLPVDSSLVAMARVGYSLLGDQLEIAVSGTNLLDFGDNRHREHPFGNQVEARVLGSVTARF